MHRGCGLTTSPAPAQAPCVADQRLRVLHRHALIDARAAGETEQRLYALDAWRETPF
jgi:hypothetical protein